MKEILYDYEEFMRKISTQAPIHHSSVGRFIDPEGLTYELTFQIHGVSKLDGHIMVFEAKKRINTLSRDFNERWVEGDFHTRLNAAVKATLDEFRCAYADPVGSTEGRLEP